MLELPFKDFGGACSSGSGRGLHPIPFSAFLPNRKELHRKCVANVRIINRIMEKSYRFILYPALFCEKS
jgi:hypothetical protein